jgi:transcriptional regulator with XRE-family HTH domain
MVDVQRPASLTLEEAFGQILRRLREVRGMKQVEVSAATGYSQRTIGMIERGEKSPTLRTMEDFAAFYEVRLEELINQAKQLRKSALYQVE